jgi:SAM-dependent methyltransferase
MVSSERQHSPRCRLPWHGGGVFGDAAAYERFMGRWSALLAPPFLDAVALTEPGSVVDVGCGTGHLAAAVVERWPASRVLGVDPSPSFVAAAGERLAGTSATARVGDAMDLPLPDDSIEGELTVVTAFTSFEDYWDPFLLGTGPAGAHVAHLSDAGRAALRAELEDHLGQGPFELTARARWVRGTVAA